MAPTSSRILFGGDPKSGGQRSTKPLTDDIDLGALSKIEYPQVFGLWLQNVWVNEHGAPTEPSELASFDVSILDGEFREYTRSHGFTSWDRGGTIEEMWLATQLSLRMPLIALLSEAQPACPVERITRKRRWRPDAIVSYLESTLELDRTCMALVYDGYFGHTILPRGFDPQSGGVIFWDPWPGDSLLCAQNNRGGARAIRYGRATWVLPRDEFAHVLFAAFITSTVTEYLGDVEAWLDERESRGRKTPSGKPQSRRKR